MQEIFYFSVKRKEDNKERQSTTMSKEIILLPIGAMNVATLGLILVIISQHLTHPEIYYEEW